MRKLASLLERMTAPSAPFMRAEGYALWLTWQGELNNVVAQSMQDYGGLSIVQDEEQGLWFFFSGDAFLSAARLTTWARFNSLPVSIAIIPGTLLLSPGRGLSVSLNKACAALEQAPPENFQAWVVEECQAAASSIPGITLLSTDPPPLAGSWKKMEADARLPYKSSLGWYALLRPLGSPLDKHFQTGWRNLFEETEKILQRNKFRYTIHNFFLMFPLETLRELKAWVGDYLRMIARVQAENPDVYWPCSLVVIDKKGLSFNNELPQKAGLDWDQLAADYPHMSFRNSLLLGPDFLPHEVRFASGGGPDDWCNVSLEGEEEASGNSLPMLVPGKLVLGNHQPCFYCGQRSHELTACPTRSMGPRDRGVWKRIATLDLAGMKEGIRSLDEAIASGGPEIIPTLVREDTPPGVLLRAIYDIGAPMQLRFIRDAWCAKGKMPPGREEPSPADNNPIWDLLDAMTLTDAPAMDKALQNLALRFPRDFRPPSLNGFAAMERGDAYKAIACWKEAESMCPPGFLQAWHLLLQARAHETLGRYGNAISLYDQAARQCPAWSATQYRKAVGYVKTGFADRGFAVLYPLLDDDPHVFNRALLDPEMERGQIQILTSLSTIWNVLESRIGDERPQLERLRAEVQSWFPPDHPFAVQASERIQRLLDMTTYKNYVPYQASLNARAALERDMHQLIARETRNFRNKFKEYVKKLAHIRDEAAWFPFPKIMVEFNKNYNKSVEKLNWALQANFGTAESFRKAQQVAAEEEEHIAALQKRLAFLRLIRDATLFVLTFLRSFFWLEIVGLLLVLVALPLLLFYGEKVGADWVLSIPDSQRWQIQKVATFAITFTAFAIAALRTLMRFDTIREELLATARDAEKKRADGKERGTKNPPSGKKTAKPAKK